MAIENNISSLGKPDFNIAGFCIWIHGRQFEESNDYWDGNWLRATAHCGDNGANVTVSGSILHLSEIVKIIDGLKKLQAQLQEPFVMEFIEPYLHFIFTPDNLGHIEFEIKLTPDHLKQVHSFIFEIDQSFLPKILFQCNEIIQKYGVRDKDQTFRRPIVN